MLLKLCYWKIMVFLFGFLTKPKKKKKKKNKNLRTVKSDFLDTLKILTVPKNKK